MNAAPADACPDATAPDERSVLVGCLNAALAALEDEDDDAWRSNVDELIQWRTRPLVQGLVRLARELELALGTGAGGGSLPEACLRLEHVVKVSEEASHHTLDLIQECGTLLGRLPGGDADALAGTVAAIRTRLSEMTAAQGYQDLTGQIIRRVVDLVRAVHEGMGEHAPGGDRPLQLSNHGQGPSVQGLDAPATSQDDANRLLTSLGL
ncbi:protein phosphatase CheZ [Luteimonas sp. MJ246]|uniref:protein phosphatase CheZ n=1 Tax=Luteimonas sp. MJ174 TaxID=3129237 RepID=UPI0031BB0E7B